MIVAVKLPNKLNERVLTFPFLHALDELLQRVAAEDPEDDTYQIHLISIKDGIDVLNLLPFHAFYHELSEEDLKTVFTAHRASASLNLNNGVDVYISTTTSFVDASLGKNINSKNKVGFDLGKNKWLLNKRIPHPGTIHKSDEVFPLIKSITGVAGDISNVSARKVSELYADWSESPYLVIDLDLVNGEINPEWLELIELSVNKRFIFMCSELGEFLQKDKLQDYIATLPSKNTYKLFHYDSNIELAKLVSYSIAFVTKSADLMTVATYCGTTTFFINPGENLKLTGPKYFRGELKEYPFKNVQSFPYNSLFDDLIALVESKTPEER